MGLVFFQILDFLKLANTVLILNKMGPSNVILGKRTLNFKSRPCESFLADFDTTESSKEQPPMP